MSVRFCGFGVCGDRGGPEEACGQLLPCAAHPDAINPEELIRERDELRGIIEASDAGPLFERLDAQHLRIAELERESNVAIEYLCHATAIITPPSTAPSKLIAMAALAADQAKRMHDAVHDAADEAVMGQFDGGVVT